MVTSCCAYGCKNEWNPYKRINYHRFPFKRPEVLKLWVEAMRRENNWFPTKTSKICGEHFLPSDYQIKPGCTLKILKLDAVPSIFVFSDTLTKKVGPCSQLVADSITPCRQLVPDPSLQMADHEIKEEPIDIEVRPGTVDVIDLPPTSLPSSGKLKVCVDRGTQTNTTGDDIIHLKRKVKTLKQQIRRKELQISKMKGLIKRGLSTDSLGTHLNIYLDD